MNFSPMSEVTWTDMQDFLVKHRSSNNYEWTDEIADTYRLALCTLPDDIFEPIKRLIPTVTGWLPTTKELLEIASDLIFHPVLPLPEAVGLFREALTYYIKERVKVTFSLDQLECALKNGSATRKTPPAALVLSVINYMGGFPALAAMNEEECYRQFSKWYTEQAADEKRKRLVKIVTNDFEYPANIVPEGTRTYIPPPPFADHTAYRELPAPAMETEA